ncbi:amino acid-binding protein [Eubacterium aggregans]|uniref:amino acid-binding protein n=1 Tax=Eubacterium aggregans TaxID=81409 RepID=UPI003F2FBB0E
MIRQVSVFIQNQEGKLGKVLDILAENDINIRSLTIAETADYGILCLILQDTDKALEGLKAAGIMANVSMVMAAEIPDKPGGLSRLMDTLTKEKINLAYAYSFLPKNTSNAIIIFKVDDGDVDRARTVLSASENVVLLDKDELLQK